jgi:hypothetical protein
VALAPDYDRDAGNRQEGLASNERDRENIFYREDFSCAEREFFTSGEKSSGSWGWGGNSGDLGGWRG